MYCVLIASSALSALTTLADMTVMPAV